MTQRSAPSLLSLPDLIVARNTGGEVHGTGVEAEADRLLISDRFCEAAEVYQSLDLIDMNQREKLAYSLYYAGQNDFYRDLGTEIEQATPWGLALHLWAFIAKRFRSDETADIRAEKLAQLLQAILKLEGWSRLREFLIAGCWFQSLQLAHETSAMRSIQSKASIALEASDSKLHASLELCARLFNFYRDRTNPQVKALEKLVASIQADDTPVLSVLFCAAMTIGDIQQASSAISVLCQRYKDHQLLESTVSAISAEAGRPEFLEFLPTELKGISLSRPEIRLLIALTNHDHSGVLAIAQDMPAGGPAESVLGLPRIAEPVFDFLFSGWTDHVGSWGGSSPWEAIFGDRLFRALPPGALRNTFLQGCRNFMEDEELDSHARELCDLFESSLSTDDFYWILRPECLQLVDAASVANYLIQTASEESKFSPFDGFEVEIPWYRFVPEIKEKLRALQPNARAVVKVVLGKWEVPLRPTLQQRLAGNGLPEVLDDPVRQLGAVITDLDGNDLAYLQLALMKLTARVAERISPAAANEVTVLAYNDFISPNYLTEYGEGRIRTLTSRYGAARFMQGLEALMNSPDFDPEADSQIPALSKMLVTLQGSLQVRRAYLAGVLRNRLKNLNSHWLDQQVVETMARGVDIEQMIDLAKGVTSWDGWSDGLASLAPY